MAVEQEESRRGLGGPVYRRFQAPRPDRKIITLWPKQRPLSRAAAEFVRTLEGPKG